MKKIETEVVLTFYIYIGYLNTDEPEPLLSKFLYKYNVKNIVKENTFFKHALNPSCVDIFIANSPLNFWNDIAVSNWISDFHKMIVAVMEMALKKNSHIERHYWD